jgi:hypothetical protein
MLKLPGHTRYVYSPIVERKDYSWPGGKRLAFYVALNIEHFAFGAGLGMDPARSRREPRGRLGQAPILPDAPVTFSTTRGCSSDILTRSAMMRAIVSVGPPTAYPTIIVIGRVG